MKKNIRVLHVGNIANNAYLNSKFLREKGIKSDVICYDYYHIMGCPEWEDCEIKGKYGNDFNPDWSKENLKNYHRPNWFYQESLEQIARDKFNWRPVFSSEGQTSPYMTKIFWYLATITDLAKSKLYKLYLARFHRPQKIQLKIMSFFGKAVAIFVAVLIRYFVWAQIQLLPKKKSPQKIQDILYYQSLIRDFKKFFPNRKDKLSLKDIQHFIYRTGVFKTIF
ncbi:MAG: hypothetical protein HW405_976, partial [Candidatus Berkelbacteria bacterium]|nr:hypothetical protein [Candidatus Berkelbacteria bacterium]